MFEPVRRAKTNLNVVVNALRLGYETFFKQSMAQASMVAMSFKTPPNPTRAKCTGSGDAGGPPALVVKTGVGLSTYLEAFKLQNNGNPVRQGSNPVA